MTTYFLIFLFGLGFGSFANVCIYRWPRLLSVNFPKRSMCPWCKASISSIENIPILSYLILFGRCRHCSSRISFQYPLIEFLMASGWTTGFLILEKLGTATLSMTGLFFFLFFILLVTTVTDLEYKIIPDQANFALLTVGILSSPWNLILGTAAFERSVQSLLGMAMGGGSLWIISKIGFQLMSKEVMGMGDVKLMMALGSVLGWKGALLVFVSGSILGGIFSGFGLLTGIVKRRQHIPFGPFLNTGAIITFFALMLGYDRYFFV